MLSQTLQAYSRRQIIGNAQSRGSAPADLDIRGSRHDQVATLILPRSQQPGAAERGEEA
jgi:hypothetical protein